MDQVDEDRQLRVRLRHSARVDHVLLRGGAAQAAHEGEQELAARPELTGCDAAEGDADRRDSRELSF